MSLRKDMQRWANTKCLKREHKARSQPVVSSESPRFESFLSINGDDCTEGNGNMALKLLVESADFRALTATFIQPNRIKHRLKLKALMIFTQILTLEESDLH